MKKLFTLIGLLGLVAGMGGALKAQEVAGDAQSKLDTIILYGNFPQDGNSHTVSFKFSATPGEKFVIRWGDSYLKMADTILVEKANEMEITYTYSKEFSNSSSRYYIVCHAPTPNGHFKSLRIDSTYKYRELVCKNCILLDTTQVTHNDLEHIDFRNCPALTFWDCSYNKITSVYFYDSNWYDNLTYLNFSHNDTKVFTATDGIALQTLDCSNNPNLWTLRTDDCKALQSLNCSNTLLHELYLPTQSALQTLDCRNTQLTYLDLMELPELRTLDCSDNSQLTQLTIQCPNLDPLRMHGNTQLTSLHVSYSRLTALDLSSNTQLTSLSLSELPVLQTLDCRNTQLTSLSLSELPVLRTLDCSNTQLPSLNMSELPALQTLNCNNTPLTHLYLSNFPALQTLTCQSTQLTTLSLSELPALKTLDCSNNPHLTSLTIQCPSLDSLRMHGNTQLTSLHVSYSRLTALDLSGNTQLTSLDCYHNQLSSLDVTDCHNLQYINCTNNHLSFIDLPKEFAGFIGCDSNHIPLSVLASLLKQCENASFSPQLIALPPLPIEQTLDLRSEMQGSDYNVEYTVYLDSTEVDNRFYTIRNGLFAFRKAGNYRVILSSELPLGMPVSGSVYYDLTVVDSIARPTFSIPSGKVKRGTEVTLSTTTPDARILYTTDGSTPDTKDALEYASPIRINSPMTIKAITVCDTVISQVATATYTIDSVANEHDLRISKLRVYVKDRTIHLSETVGEIEVFTMDGHCVYRGHETAIPVKQSGLYVVSANGRRWKVAVR